MYKIKTCKMSELFVLMLMICIMGLNSYNCDMQAYITLYARVENGIWPGGIEYGFILLMKLFVYLGLSYEVLLFTVALTGSILIYKGLGYFTTNRNLVLLFYLFFPFLLDLIQIRNFLVVALFVYAVHYLMEFSISNTVKYIFFIFFAASFHSVAYIYLLFLIVYIKNEKKFNTIINISFICCLLFLVFFEKIFDTVSLFAPNIRRYILLGLDGTSLTAKIVFAIYVIIVNLIFNHIEKYYQNHKLNELQKNHNVIMKIARIASLFYFVMIFEVDFYRIYRNLIILFYIVWCDFIYKNRLIRMKALVLVLFFVGISFVAFIGAYTFDTVVTEVLTNNRLFDWILS